jgi:hypothetical protein
MTGAPFVGDSFNPMPPDPQSARVRAVNALLWRFQERAQYGHKAEADDIAKLLTLADSLDGGKALDAPGKKEAGGGAESQATPETDTTLIYQADAATFYNIPKSGLSKAAKKKPSAPGYLWTGRDDKGKGKRKRVWYRKKDLEKVAQSRKAYGRAGQSSEKLKEKPSAQVAPRVSSRQNLEEKQKAFLANCGQNDTESED